MTVIVVAVMEAGGGRLVVLLAVHDGGDLPFLFGVGFGRLREAERAKKRQRC